MKCFDEFSYYIYLLFGVKVLHYIIHSYNYIHKSGHCRIHAIVMIKCCFSKWLSICLRMQHTLVGYIGRYYFLMKGL